MAGKVENLTNAGKGRKKGVQNKITTEAKKAFAEAFEELGGVDALVRWARKNPETFYKLYSKLIPVTIGGTDPSGAITVIVSAKEAKL